MAITVLPFHHGLRLVVEKDEAPPIKIPATGIILLVGTAPSGPVNTPYLITGGVAEAVSIFGKWQPWHAAEGLTIPEALHAIYQVSSPLVVVINAAATTNAIEAEDNNVKFDRSGFAYLSRQNHLTSPAMEIDTGAVITGRKLPPSGGLTITLPKGYVSVSAVKAVGNTAVVGTYNGTTGVYTVTSGATFNDELTFAVTGAWSETTDYIYDAVDGTLKTRAGGRLLPGMTLAKVSYSYVGFSGAYSTMAGMITGTIASNGTRTGIQLGHLVQSLVGVSPKLIICPRFTDRTAENMNIASNVALELERVAKTLGGRAFISAEDSLGVVDFVNTLGHYADPDSRMGCVAWPYIRIAGPDGELTTQPPCARIAATQSMIDATLGFHESFSGKKLEGVLGVTKSVTHSWTDVGTQSDFINENGGVVIVSEEGFYKSHGAWQPNGEMLNVLRTADAINIAIVEGSRWALDRAIGKERVRQVIQRIKSLLRDLEADGVLIKNPNPSKAGNDVWFDPTLNSDSRLAQGKVVYSYRINPPPLMTDITFNAHITSTFLEAFAKSVANG
ncbi:MAG: phage tail sheath C-terminal domain-containing protein [Chitinophagaceae bacterium]